MSRNLFALRYMTRFRCIAEKCEDTCCAGMRIFMTAQNEVKLRQAMSGTPMERLELSGKTVRSGDPAAGYTSSIAFRNDRICSFLLPDQFCSLIQRYGEDVIPDVCANFPRALSHWPDRVEVSATMACPEAARLCLLVEDSTDLVPAEPTVASRIPDVPLSAEPEAYVAFVDEVRGAGLSLLAGRRHPIASRLVQLADLGARVHPFFHRGSKAFEGAAKNEAEARLRAELSRSLEPTHQNEVHRAFLAAVAPGELFIQTVAGLLQALGPTANARFLRLTPAALGTYQRAALEEDPSVAEPGGPLWSVLWRVYEQKRARAEAVLGERLEGYLRRYWQNDWHREWYTRAPSLQSHAFRMLLRLGTLKFLLLGHPVVDALAEHLAAGRAATAEDFALLDQAVVETCQILAKRVEQSTDLMHTLDERLTPELFGTDALGRARAFAKAC